MSRNNGLVIGQKVSHAHAGIGYVAYPDANDAVAKQWILVKLADGSYEYWKMKQIRVKVGIS